MKARPFRSAEIITVGWEVLRGQTLDGNSAYVGSRLFEAGVEVRWRTSVGDDVDAIVDAVKRAMSRADLVVMTGGLGPTPDDLTKGAVCRAFNLKLMFVPALWRSIRARYRGRGIKVPNLVREQAFVPVGRGVGRIGNVLGSAQGIVVERRGRVLAALPGVPREMRDMFDRGVMPSVRRRAPRGSATAIVKTIGITESQIHERIADVVSGNRELDVAFLPSYEGVTMRFRARGSIGAARRALGRCLAIIRERIGAFIYAEDERSISEVVGAVLRERGETLSAAESCTGGLIAGRITDVPGSSGYFAGGVVSYSNEAKVDLVGVRGDLIKTHGAVSVEVAAAMAEGARSRFGTTWALSATGVAGPTGGTAEKPVGLVFVGLSGPPGTKTARLMMGADREVNRARTVGYALAMLWRELKGIS